MDVFGTRGVVACVQGADAADAGRHGTRHASSMHTRNLALMARLLRLLAPVLLLEPSVVAQVATSSCQWEAGRDFLAAGAPPQNASTKEECCAICRNTSSCVAGVWCPPTRSGDSCGLTTGICYTKFSTTAPRNTSSTVIACVIPPTPGVLAPPKLGDAVFMNNCSEGDPHGAMKWTPCAGEACFEPGAFGVGPARTSVRNPGGLCLDASGGFPGWAARIMPCDTTFDSQFWGNNPITSTTWRLGSDGTLRTNISRSGSPLNASGEVCLFSSLPGADSINGDWWTSGGVGLWWCEGVPPESRWVFADGQLQAASGPRAGLCLCSTDEALPTPKPPVPDDPINHTVRCPSGCHSPPCSGFPYCDATLSAQARAEDFVARLSLQEKANAIMWLGAQVKRLGTPTVTYGEAQHGLVKPCIDRHGVACTSPDTRVCKCATSFPSLVGVGATFNRSLFKQMGDVMGDEARAYYTVLKGETNMVMWAPNINLARNVYWGRNQETPGEDPTVNGVYAEDFISSIQGTTATDWTNPHAPPLKTAATIKHFLAYDVECSSGGKVTPTSTRDAIGGGATTTLFDCDAPGVDRFHFEGFVSDADLNDYYLPVFSRPLSRARPAAIMCSFASLNGVPSCANGLMQNTLARQSWGFEGFIATDCGAVDFLNQGHYWTNSPPAAVAAAIRNGSDLEIGIPGPWGHGYYFQTHMNQTIEQKLLEVRELDRAATRVWRTAFRLGLFEPVSSSPWGALGWEDIDSEQNQGASMEAARQSLTLLENRNATLPLDARSLRALAIIGPFANVTTELMGGYTGPNLRVRSLSPSTVLQRRFAAESTRLLFAAGAVNGANRTDQIAAAVHTSEQADATILFVGDTHVAEFADRTWNGLEYSQVELIRAVCASGKRVTLVVVAGHSIDLTVAKKSCGAIIFAFLPSQFGGDAIADVLLGDYSPAGRLPVTFYDSSLNDWFDPTDMSLRQGMGVTYMHHRGEPLYEFGYGLSYSSFEFAWSKPPRVVSTTKAAADNAELVYHVTVTNSGKIAAGVAVLAFVNTSAEELAPFISADVQVPTPPVRTLFNFTRVFLARGASAQLEFSLEKEALALSDNKGDRAVRPGRYTIAIGGVGRAGRVEDGAVAASLELYGEEHVLFSMRELRRRHAAAT